VCRLLFFFSKLINGLDQFSIAEIYEFLDKERSAHHPNGKATSYINSMRIMSLGSQSTLPFTILALLNYHIIKTTVFVLLSQYILNNFSMIKNRKILITGEKRQRRKR
jgi:hypothetical protein